MKSQCKTCLTHTCSCKKQVDYNENDVKHMNSPVSHKRYGTMSDKKFRLSSTVCNSPLQTIKELECVTDTNFASTPSKSSAVTINNPFELEIDSLHASSYSPSIFSVTRKDSQENVPFRWSIEQLALLHPAEIDETSQQSLCSKLDAETEVKAQEAIDAFFSKNLIAPSPWTPSMKYTSFIPQLASTAWQTQTGHQNSCESCSVSDETSGPKNVSTQTMLTIPPGLDLMALLGQFYTYQVKLPNDSTDCSSCDLDMLSTSFRRRKLFMNDDEISVNSSLNREQNNNLPSKFMSPDLKSRHWSATTPFSDHCSSSPITPRNFSLSANCAGISISSPNISPICASPPSSRILRSPCRNLEISLEKAESHVSTDSLSSTEQQVVDTEFHSVMMTSASEIDVVSSGSMTSEPSKQSNCHLHVEDKTFLNSSSNQKDTGYLTGSINSTASLILQQASSYTQLRATPVAELLGDCAITEHQLFHPDNNNISCSMNDSMMTTNQTECFESSSVPINFNMSWQPNKFSTPSKTGIFSK